MSEKVKLNFLPQSTFRKKLRKASGAIEPPAKKLKLDSDELDVDETKIMKKKTLKYNFGRKLATKDAELEIAGEKNVNLISEFEKELALKISECNDTGKKNEELRIEIKKYHSGMLDLSINFEKQLAKKNAELEIAAKEKHDLELNNQRDLQNLSSNFEKELAAKCAELHAVVKEKKELRIETKLIAEKQNEIMKYIEGKTLVIEELQEKQKEAEIKFNFELDEKVYLMEKLEKEKMSAQKELEILRNKNKSNLFEYEELKTKHDKTDMKLKDKDQLVEKLEKELKELKACLATKTTEEEFSKQRTKCKIEMMNIEDELSSPEKSDGNNIKKEEYWEPAHRRNSTKVHLKFEDLPANESNQAKFAVRQEMDLDTGTNSEKKFNSSDITALIISNISAETSRLEIQDLFKPYGDINQYIFKKIPTKVARVLYKKKESCDRAIKNLHKVNFNGSELSVQYQEREIQSETLDEKVGEKQSFSSTVNDFQIDCKSIRNLSNQTESTHNVLHISNLPHSSTVLDVENIFKSFVGGDKFDVRLKKNQMKCFGWVTLNDENAASEAMKILNGTKFKGRFLRIRVHQKS